MNNLEETGACSPGKISRARKRDFPPSDTSSRFELSTFHMYGFEDNWGRPSAHLVLPWLCPYICIDSDKENDRTFKKFA